jgi:RHS repeat-associated protein
MSRRFLSRVSVALVFALLGSGGVLGGASAALGATASPVSSSIIEDPVKVGRASSLPVPAVDKLDPVVGSPTTAPPSDRVEIPASQPFVKAAPAPLSAAVMEKADPNAGPTVARKPSGVSSFDPGTSVEEPAKRTATSSTFKNADGSFTANISTTPIHFRNKNKGGAFEKIDSGVIEDAGNGFRSSTNEWTARFKPLPAGVTLELADDSKVSMSPVAGADRVKPVRGPDGVSVVYPEVFPGVDFRYTVTAVGVKEDVVVKNSSAAASFAFDYKGVDLVPSKSMPGAFVDGGRKETDFFLSPPVVLDVHEAQYPKESGAKLERVPGPGDKNGKSSRMQLSVDPAWLKGLDASVFPISIDPSTTLTFFKQEAFGGSDIITPNGWTCPQNPLCLTSWTGNARPLVGSTEIDVIWRSTTSFDYAALLPTQSVKTAVTNATFTATFAGGSQASQQLALRWAKSYSFCGVFSPGTNFNGQCDNPSYIPTIPPVQSTATGALAYNVTSTLQTPGVWVAGQGCCLVAWMLTSDEPLGPGGYTHKKWTTQLSIDYTSVPNDTATYATGASQQPTSTVPGYVDVIVTNTGGQTWTTAGGYQLGSHLIDSLGNTQNFEYSAMNFPANVPPGTSTTTMRLPLPAIAPGNYKIQLDVVKRGSYWFSWAPPNGPGSPVGLITGIQVLPSFVAGSAAVTPNNGASNSTPAPNATVSVQVSAFPGGNPAAVGYLQVCQDAAMSTGCALTGWLPATFPNGAGQPGVLSVQFGTNNLPLLTMYKSVYWKWTFSQNSFTAAPMGSQGLTAQTVPVLAASGGGGGGGDSVQGVNTNNLTFSVNSLDASLAGSGPQASVQRTYNSGLTTNSGQATPGLFGVGWTTDMDTHLEFDAYSNATIIFGDAQAETWGRPISTTACTGGVFCAKYVAPPGTLGQLVADSPTAPTLYRLLTPSGGTFDFNAWGRLTQITNSSGQRITLTYTGTGPAAQLTQVANPSNGRALTFTWSAGKVSSVSTPAVAANAGAAYVWTYEYNPSGLLWKVHDPVNPPLKYTEYRYNITNSNLLEQVILPSGIRQSLVVYATTKVRGVYPVVSVTDAAGKLWQFSKVDGATVVPNPKTSVTFPDASVHFWDYSGGPYGGLSAVCPTYDTSPTNCAYTGYDAGGFVNKITDNAGRITSYVNDVQGRVLSKAGPGPGTTFYGYPVFDTANPGDPRNMLPIWMADQRSTDVNDVRYRTLYEYTTPTDGVLGLLKKTTDPTGIVTETRTYTLTTTPAVGVGGGIVGVAGLLLTVTNATGQITSYAYDKNGDRLTTTDPAGLITAVTYDEVGRAKQSVVTWENGGTRTDTNVYDGLDRAVQRTGPAVTNTVAVVAHQQRIVTAYNFDGQTATQTVSDAANGGDVARTTTLGYDTAGRNNTTTDPAGLVTTRTFDELGRVKTEKTPGKPLYTFAYAHPLGVLTSVTAAAYTHPYSTAVARDVVVAQYQYDLAGALVRETDALGHIVRHDLRGDLLPTADVLENYHPPTGPIRAYTIASADYDNAGNATHETSLDGTRHTYRAFAANSRVLSSSPTTTCTQLCTMYEYDAAGRVKRMADNLTTPTIETTRTYDTAGRIETSNLRQVVGASPNYATTRYGYDRRGLNTTLTDPAGYIQTYTYDTAGRLLTSNRAGMTVEQNQTALTAQTITATVGYNTFGAATHQKDGRGNITVTAYDTNSRVTKVTAPAYQQPAGALLTPARTFSYNATSGLLTSSTDWSARSTSYEYDSFGRVARQVAPVVPAGTPSTLAYTDDLGRTVRTVSPVGTERTATFDDLGRPTASAIKERTQTTPGFLTTSVAYNEAAGTVSTTNPVGAVTVTTINTLGQVTADTDATGRKIEYAYDTWGRMTADFDASHSVMHDYYYDAASRNIRTRNYYSNTATSVVDSTWDSRGLRASLTDGAGATSRWTYDARGLVASLAEPVTASTGLVTTLGYDAAGNNTRRTNPAGAVTWYTYNNWQQPESTIEPSTTTYPNAIDRTYTTSYTSDRDVATELEPGNITRAYTYFTGNQLGTITSKLGATTSAAITYTRDLIGRQTKAVSGTSTIVSGYNDRDQPTQVTNGTTVTNYTYDNASRLASRADQAGTTSYTYDLADRLATMADPLTALTSAYTYDYAGRPDTVVTGGATRKYTYDRMGRNLTDTNQTTTGATPVLSTTNEWDNADRLTKRTTGPTGVAGAGIETFGYDQASRLTSWTNQANITTAYTWSAASNRTAAGANTFSYNERNQLTTQTVAGTTSTYAYQPNGALSSTTSGAATTARSYDGLGRQTLVGATSYTYDALGRLTGAGSNTLGYAGLEQEPVTDNAVLYSRTPTGTINASKTGATAALVTTNIHGDIAATINPTTGAVTGRRTYDPTGVPILTTTVGNTGYQSQYTDPATAEIHAQTRNYQPTSARFTTRDTLTLPATSSPNINRYTYANANPITNTDTTGHFLDWNAIAKAAEEAAKAAAKAAGGGGAVAALSGPAALVIVIVGGSIAAQVVNADPVGAGEDAYTAAYNAAEAQDALYQQTHGCGNSCGTPSSPTPTSGGVDPGCGPRSYPCGGTGYAPGDVPGCGPATYPCGITPTGDPGPGEPVAPGSKFKPKPNPTPQCKTNCAGNPKPIGTVEDPRTKGINGATANTDPTAPVVLPALAAATAAIVAATEAAPPAVPQTANAGGARRGGGKQPPACQDLTYQTYTKTNPDTSKVYSGRTSGRGTPSENVDARDASHHMNKQGYGPAVLDQSSVDKFAIRGREQQLIDANGGACSKGGTSGNAINGVSPSNPLAPDYTDAANTEFGRLLV